MSPRFRKDFLLALPVQSAGAFWLTLGVSQSKPYGLVAQLGILLPWLVVCIWLAGRPAIEIVRVILVVFPVCAGNLLLSFAAGRLAVWWLEQP